MNRRGQTLALLLPWLISSPASAFLDYLGGFVCQNENSLLECGGQLALGDPLSKICSGLAVELEMALSPDISPSVFYQPGASCGFPDLSSPNMIPLDGSSSLQTTKEISLDKMYLPKSAACGSGLISVVLTIKSNSTVLDHSSLPVEVTCPDQIDVSISMKNVTNAIGTTLPLEPGVANPLAPLGITQLELLVPPSNSSCLVQVIAFILCDNSYFSGLPGILGSGITNSPNGVPGGLDFKTTRSPIYPAKVDFAPDAFRLLHQGPLINSNTSATVSLNKIMIPKDLVTSSGKCRITFLADPFMQCPDPNRLNNNITLSVTLNRQALSTSRNGSCSVKSDYTFNGESALICGGKDTPCSLHRYETHDMLTNSIGSKDAMRILMADVAMTVAPTKCWDQCSVIYNRTMAKTMNGDALLGQMGLIFKMVAGKWEAIAKSSQNQSDLYNVAMMAQAESQMLDMLANNPDFGQLKQMIKDSVSRLLMNQNGKGPAYVDPLDPIMMPFQEDGWQSQRFRRDGSRHRHDESNDDGGKRSRSEGGKHDHGGQRKSGEERDHGYGPNGGQNNGDQNGRWNGQGSQNGSYGRSYPNQGMDGGGSGQFPYGSGYDYNGKGGGKDSREQGERRGMPYNTGGGFPSWAISGSGGGHDNYGRGSEGNEGSGGGGRRSREQGSFGGGINGVAGGDGGRRPGSGGGGGASGSGGFPGGSGGLGGVFEGSGGSAGRPGGAGGSGGISEGSGGFYGQSGSFGGNGGWNNGDSTNNNNGYQSTAYGSPGSWSSWSSGQTSQRPGWVEGGHELGWWSFGLLQTGLLSRVPSCGRMKKTCRRSGDPLVTWQTGCLCRWIFLGSSSFKYCPFTVKSETQGLFAKAATMSSKKVVQGMVSRGYFNREYEVLLQRIRSSLMSEPVDKSQVSAWLSQVKSITDIEIQTYNRTNSTITTRPAILTYFSQFLASFNDADLDVITSSLKTIQGKMILQGDECDWAGWIGSPPTEEEFCRSLIGRRTGRAMTCRQDARILKNTCIGSSPKVWRKTGNTIQVGSFCPVTGEWHWTDKASCSCDLCGRRQ